MTRPHSVAHLDTETERVRLAVLQEQYIHGEATLDQLEAAIHRVLTTGQMFTPHGMYFDQEPRICPSPFAQH